MVGMSVMFSRLGHLLRQDLEEIVTEGGSLKRDGQKWGGWLLK